MGTPAASLCARLEFVQGVDLLRSAANRPQGTSTVVTQWEPYPWISSSTLGPEELTALLEANERALFCHWHQPRPGSCPTCAAPVGSSLLQSCRNRTAAARRPGPGTGIRVQLPHEHTSGPEWMEPETKSRTHQTTWEAEYTVKVPLWNNVGFLPHTLVRNKSL